MTEDGQQFFFSLRCSEESSLVVPTLIIGGWPMDQRRMGGDSSERLWGC